MLFQIDMAGGARRIRIPGPGGDVEMATVHDPDGVLVELVGTARMPS